MGTEAGEEERRHSPSGKEHFSRLGRYHLGLALSCLCLPSPSPSPCCFKGMENGSRQGAACIIALSVQESIPRS
jgi:hypothetical protein